MIYKIINVINNASMPVQIIFGLVFLIGGYLFVTLVLIFIAELIRKVFE